MSIPMTPLGIKLATFPQCVNQLRHRVPQNPLPVYVISLSTKSSVTYILHTDNKVLRNARAVDPVSSANWFQLFMKQTWIIPRKSTLAPYWLWRCVTRQNRHFLHLRTKLNDPAKCRIRSKAQIRIQVVVACRLVQYVAHFWCSNVYEGSAELRPTKKCLTDQLSVVTETWLGIRTKASMVKNRSQSYHDQPGMQKGSFCPQGLSWNVHLFKIIKKKNMSKLNCWIGIWNTWTVASWIKPRNKQWLFVSIVSAMKSRRMRWAKYVTGTKQTRNLTKFWL
jgi:hypothetical protein